MQRNVRNKRTEGKTNSKNSEEEVARQSYNVGSAQLFANSRKGDVFLYLPANIRFTHSSIKSRFRDGMPIVQTLRYLDERKLSPFDIPPLVVYWFKNTLWSLSNRRLWVYKQMRHQVLVPVVITKDSKKFKKSFTSPCAGMEIELFWGRR